jgi:hypothetical protein
MALFQQLDQHRRLAMEARAARQLDNDSQRGHRKLARHSRGKVVGR